MLGSRWLCLSFVSILTVAGCADVSEDSAYSGSDLVVGVANIADQVTVRDDELEFDVGVVPKFRQQGVIDKMDAYAKADDKSAVEPVIFVGRRAKDALNADGTVKKSSRNALGYLRRAISYTTTNNGRLIVKTAPSNFNEAAKELEKNGFFDVPSNSTTKFQSESDSSAPKRTEIDHTFSFPVIDKSGVTLLQKDAGSSKLTVTMKTAKLTVEPNLKATFESSDSIAGNGSVFISGKVDGKVEFEANATGSLSLNVAGSLPSPPSIALDLGVPVTLNLDLAWKCSATTAASATLSIGAEATGTLNRIGATWEGTSVTPVMEDPSYTFSAIGPTFTASVTETVECHLIPKVSAQLFDIVGPHASIDLWAKVVGETAETDKVSASLYLGGDLTLGGGLAPFGINVASLDAPPIHFGPQGEAVLSDTFSIE